MKFYLSELLSLQQKSKIQANMGQNIGIYKFFTCSPIQNKFLDEFNYCEESLIIGTGGKCSVHYCNEPFSTSTDCLVFYSKNNDVLKLKWLYYLLRDNPHILERGFHGSGLKHISRNFILGLKIDLPTLDIQNSIVSILDKINSLIDKVSLLISKHDLLVKSQFIEMFGDFNLSQKGNDWVKIKNLGLVIGGSTPKTANESYWNGQYCWITPDELNDDSYIVSDTARHITLEGVRSCSLKPLPVGTVLLSSRAPIGKLAVAGIEMYCNQGFKNIICGDKLNHTYLYCLLKYNVKFLQSLGRGSTFLEVSKSIVENISIPCPPIELQKDFAFFFEQIDKSKFRLKELQSKLENLYKSLLQKYFG